MNKRLAAGAALLIGLLGLGAATLQARRMSQAEAEAEAWERIARGYTVHHCEAPESPVYRSSELSYVHISTRGLGMATLAPSGSTTLLDTLEPIGTLTWSEAGCEVRPVTYRNLEVQVLHADGTPAVGASVASCFWMDLAWTGPDGRVTLSVPPSVRCKLAATLAEGDEFWASSALALEDDLDEVTLTLDAEPKSVATHKQELAITLDALANRASKTVYDRAMSEASPAAREVLATWRDQYRLRQKDALASMRGFLEDGGDGWRRLTR